MIAADKLQTKDTHMRSIITLAALALAAACNPAAQPPAPEASASASPALPPVAPPTCTGDKLPLTGACAEAQPAIFGYVRNDAPLLASTCIWKTTEVQRSETEALVFRSQDCSAEGWGPVTYRFDGPQKLTIRYSPAAPGGEAPESPIAWITDLADGKTAEDVAMATLSEAPENERARCQTKPLPNVKDVAGQAFELGPNAELDAELHKDADGPVSGCGPFGFTEDAVVFWEKRPGHAIFHAIGQDDPYWDPSSFTVYKRDANGAWTKQ